MNFETLLKQIVKEAVVEALSEVEPKNWTTNDIHEEEPHNEAPSVEPEEEVTVEEPETEEVDLGSMKLKELREYAEELGLNSKGKRAEVEDRIREFLANQEDSEDEDLGEEPEEETETEDEESEEPEIEENEDSEEDEDSEEAEDDEVEDETYAKVMQYVNEASDDELRETLEELGLSSKGKREALVEKIYQAVKDGLFEFEEDEEPSEDVEPEEETDEETDEDLGITEERAKAIEAMEEQVQEEFEEGKITRKEMVAYLKQVGIAVTKKVEDEAVVEMYTEKLALLIDDEGEFHDEGGDPYNINEVPYCCGAPLEEIEGGYRCNVCGTEYEAE